MNMLDVANVRLFSRRSRKYWAVGLSAASFACGNYLFGDDNESLLSQYQQATQQLVAEVQPATPRPQAAAKAGALAPKPQSIKVEATAKDISPAQKSSRRVKPTAQPTGESGVAKSETPATVERSADEPPAARESSVEKHSELAQDQAVSPPADQSPGAAAHKPLPLVTYLPAQSAVTPKQVAPRMEIITPDAGSTQSPRAQSMAAQSAPMLGADPLPTQAEIRLPAPPPILALPQMINVSRQAGSPFPPRKPVALSTELDDDHLRRSFRPIRCRARAPERSNCSRRLKLRPCCALTSAPSSHLVETMLAPSLNRSILPSWLSWAERF